MSAPTRGDYDVYRRRVKRERVALDLFPGLAGIDSQSFPFAARVARDEVDGTEPGECLCAFSGLGGGREAR